MLQISKRLRHIMPKWQFFFLYDLLSQIYLLSNRLFSMTVAFCHATHNIRIILIQNIYSFYFCTYTIVVPNPLTATSFEGTVVVVESNVKVKITVFVSPASKVS